MSGDEPAADQIDKLADYIQTTFPGEPSRSEGAVDTAIRIMSDQARWLSFGRAILLLADTPFAEWNISEVPGLTKAGVQVRQLADRYGLHR